MSSAANNRLQHIAVEKSRLHIPIIFGFDVIHGYRTVFPVPLAMASSWDPSVEEQAQHLAAEDARAAGIQWTFTPMVDIARDARWGRIVEGAGEDPYLGSAMARAQVRGFQGPKLGPNSVLACVKHFAGYGAAEGGRDYDSVYVPEELMENVYLVPFHAAEEAGAGSFMSAYMDLNEVPATGNHLLLTDVLRKDWGFQGVVLSDAFAVGSLVTHGYAKDGEDAAYKAITAGLNMDMASLTYSHNLARLVHEGKVSESYLDEMVLPILETKYDLGLFEHPYAHESKVEAICDSSVADGLGRWTHAVGQAQRDFAGSDAAGTDAGRGRLCRAGTAQADGWDTVWRNCSHGDHCGRRALAFYGCRYAARPAGLAMNPTLSEYAAPLTGINSWVRMQHSRRFLKLTRWHSVISAASSSSFATIT